MISKRNGSEDPKVHQKAVVLVRADRRCVESKEVRRAYLQEDVAFLLTRWAIPYGVEISAQTRSVYHSLQEIP